MRKRILSILLVVGVLFTGCISVSASEIEANSNNLGIVTYNVDTKETSVESLDRLQ